MRTAIAKRPPDVFGAATFVWLRIIVLIGISAAGAIAAPESESTRLFFRLMTFAALPASLLLLAALDRLRPFTHSMVSAVVDVTCSVALHALVADGAQVARLAYVVIPAVVAISSGFLPGLVFTMLGATANAAIDFFDDGGALNPVVHLGRLALATLLVYLVARATDDRRKAQASERAASVKAETILSKVTSAVVVTDAIGRLREWNEAAVTVMFPVDELGPGELRCDKALGLQANGRPLDCSNGCALLRLRRDYRPDDMPEISRRLPDGRRQPLIAEAAAVTDDDGRVAEVVHSLLDVTRLKQADEAKTLFLATASHELKTPLTVISGFAELLLSMPELPADQRNEGLQTIRRRSAELSSIVDRLLLSSRIEAGNVQLSLQPIDVKPLLRERADALSRTTGREIAVRVCEELPRADADTAAVSAIVDHLLENAIRYSPGGGAVEAIAESAGEHVQIQVIDRGIGMDSQQQQRCFERFWQAESTDVRRFGGTGIGLYIVKSLTEAMGGSIEVTSVPGRGTTFTLRLPAAPQSGLDAGGAILGEVLDHLESAPGGGG